MKKPVGEAIDRKTILTAARKLQAGYAKETGGEVLPWAELPDKERSLWMRLATRVGKVYLPG